jgi:hypothetical protein
VAYPGELRVRLDNLRTAIAEMDEVLEQQGHRQQKR